MRVGLLHACAIDGLTSAIGLTQGFSLDLLGNSEKQGAPPLSAVRIKPNKYISLDGGGQLLMGPVGLYGPGGFRFVDDLFDFDRAVGDERAQRANRGGDRSNDGTNDSRGQRELAIVLPFCFTTTRRMFPSFNELSKL
jgi:hypothetical protein